MSIKYMFCGPNLDKVCVLLTTADDDVELEHLEEALTDESLQQAAVVVGVVGQTAESVHGLVQHSL